jgi:hypothetical protein
MCANKTELRIELSNEEKGELERAARSLVAPHRSVVRARVIVLLVCHSLSAISREVGLRRRIIRKWGLRFVKKRLAGLKDEPRSGRPPRFPPGGVAASGETGVRAA